MESIILPEVAARIPAYAVPERRARAHEPPARERFAPLWLRATLILATVLALALLYPRSYIETRLRRVSAPNAAALAYLRLMVIAQPAETDTRILLARQALRAGDLALSRYALEPWRNREFSALPPDIALLRLRLLRAELYRQRPGSLPHADLAHTYTREVLLLAPRMQGADLLREARLIAALGQYRTAALLYRQLIAHTRNPALRLEAFHAGIGALRAAGEPREALAFARSELAFMAPSAQLWRQMTRLALMADAPRLAARYARRLVGVQRP